MTHYLFKHPEVDFIWVTGGPKIVELANAAGKPGLSVGPGNAPIYIHRTADVRGAVVDILISKTFDASVICPAEQTCIVDDEVYDEMVAEFQRMGAHLLTPDEVDALAEFAFGARRHRSTWRRSGSRRPQLAARAGFSVDPDHQDPAGAAARRPRRARRAPAGAGEADAGARAGPRARASSTASTSRSWSPSTAGSGTPRRSTPTTRPSSTRTRWRSAPAGSWSTRRPRSARSAASTTT